MFRCSQGIMEPGIIYALRGGQRERLFRDHNWDGPWKMGGSFLLVENGGREDMPGREWHELKKCNFVAPLDLIFDDLPSLSIQSWSVFGEVNGILLWTLLALLKLSKTVACHRILNSSVFLSTKPVPQWMLNNTKVCVLNFQSHLYF